MRNVAGTSDRVASVLDRILSISEKGMILNHLKLRVDSEDQSFMPTQVSVYARESSPDKNTLLKDVHIRENTKYNRAVTLLGQQKKISLFHPFENQ